MVVQRCPAVPTALGRMRCGGWRVVSGQYLSAAKDRVGGPTSARAHTLMSGTHPGHPPEEHGAHGHLQVRRGVDDQGVVAPELEDGLAEAPRHHPVHEAAHLSRSRAMVVCLFVCLFVRVSHCM